MNKRSYRLHISLPVAAAAFSMLLTGAGFGYIVGARGRTIDWSATGSFLQGLAALLAASVAAWGVNRWQQELRFKRNAELAEKVMVCVEALGDAIIRTRARPNDYEIYEPVGDRRVLTNVSYRLRTKVFEHKDYVAELRTHVHRVGVLLGSSYRFSLETLLSLSDSLRSALTNASWESAQLENPQVALDDVVAELRRLSTILFENIDSTDDDPFGRELDKAFDQLRRQFHKDL